LTFLRFFALFAGASESGADGRLSFDGELLLGALLKALPLPDAAALGAVTSPEAAPLDFRAPSVIKCDRPGPVAFLGEPQINTFYNTLVTPEKTVALAVVGRLWGSTAIPAAIVEWIVEWAFQSTRMSECSWSRG
jgi:hypothetical protein